MINRVVLSLLILLMTGCATAKSLPPQEVVDKIRVERNYPKEELVVLKKPEEIKRVIAFINTKLEGWDVPWYGPPVGQIYLELYKGEKYVGNFYVGPYFFGRDHGNFWSQSASKEDIKHLGTLLGIELLELIDAAR